jgi:hypothetical protein
MVGNWLTGAVNQYDIHNHSFPYETEKSDSDSDADISSDDYG